MAIKTWEERSVTLPDMGWADKQYANKHAMLDEIKELLARVAELEAELAALKAQKPVAWVKYARKKPSVRALSWQKEPSPAEHALGFVSDALYAEAGAQPVPCQRCDELKQANSALADAAIVKDGWQIVPDAVKQDAKRYQWLTADLSAADGREKRNELLSRMPVMSYSRASTDIDAAMLEAAKGKPCPDK